MKWASQVFTVSTIGCTTPSIFPDGWPISPMTDTLPYQGSTTKVVPHQGEVEEMPKMWHLWTYG